MQSQGIINRRARNFDFFKVLRDSQGIKCGTFFLLLFFDNLSSSPTTRFGTTNSKLPISVSRLEMFFIFFEAMVIRKLVSQITLTNCHTRSYQSPPFSQSSAYRNLAVFKQADRPFELHLHCLSSHTCNLGEQRGCSYAQPKRLACLN